MEWLEPWNTGFEALAKEAECDPDEAASRRGGEDREAAQEEIVGTSMRIEIILIALGIALIAAAIALTGRWEIMAQDGVIYRLDRWSGEIRACVYPRSLVTDAERSGGYAILIKCTTQSEMVVPQ
jgi:hypothetical protein